MNPQLKKLVTKAVIDIGNEIEMKAISSNGGIFWKTKAIGSNPPTWVANPSIYMGGAGIILFLIELYFLTGSKRYLECAKKGAGWIVEFYETETNFSTGSFYTGSVGAIYTLLLVSKVSGDPFFATSAKKLLYSAKRYNQPVDDLLTGTAGIIIGLLHIDKVTKDDFALGEIEYYLNKVLANAYLTKQGVHWDRSERVVTGLCGLSHGAAGMGYTFLEVAKYFRNSAYADLANEAFNYENAHYKKTTNNWPDYRKLIYNDASAELFKDNFLKKNNKFFEKGGDFTAWCHGANGIAFSRLSAYEFLRKKEHHTDLKNAVSKVLTTNEYPSYTLCHGYGGDVLLLLEVYKFTKKKDYFDKAVKIVMEGINLENKIHKYIDGTVFRENEEDISLFNGLAGVGYTMLSLLNPTKVFNILSPKVTSNVNKGRVKESRYPTICIDSVSIKKRILNTYFPASIKSINPNAQFYKKTPLSSEVIRYFKKLQPGKNYLSDIERMKVKLEATVRSWPLFAYAHKIEKEKVKSLLQDNNTFLHNSILLGLSKYAKLVKSRDEGRSSSIHCLIYLTTSDCRSRHMEISEFEYDVLRFFKNPALTGEVYKRIETIYSSNSDMPNGELGKIFDNCIKNSLFSLILFTRTT